MGGSSGEVGGVAIGANVLDSPIGSDVTASDRRSDQTSSPTARIRARALLWRTTPGRIR